MKRIIMLLTLISMLFMGTGCKKDKLQANVIGEWHCSVEECDIYLAFSPDGTFELYQKLGEGRYCQYNGTWNADKDVLSGNYNDGTPWGSSYEVKSEGSDKLVFTATNGSSEVNTYVRETIPEEVRKESLVTVKSGGIPVPVL